MKFEEHKEKNLFMQICLADNSQFAFSYSCTDPIQNSSYVWEIEGTGIKCKRKQVYTKIYNSFTAVGRLFKELFVAYLHVSHNIISQRFREN